MEINLHKVTVREVIEGYKDSDEEGVVAYRGMLNIRPKYQREFIYDDKQRDAVIKTISKGFPLNVMYWIQTDQGSFELMDGQQRTISIGQYINGDFSLIFNDNPYNRQFVNLTEEEKDQILNYELMIYFCEGTDKQRLDWFKTINIAGEKLTNQEMRNAVFTGSWLSDAKLKFSKSNCVAYLLASDNGSLVKGSPIRQEYLEVVLKWISGGTIDDYMAIHQHDKNADELWQYFQDVIEWVRKTFIKYRKDMKGVDWGKLYNEYKDVVYDVKDIEEKTLELIDDDDVTSLKGIYEYILTGDEKHLNIRQFNNKIKTKVFEKQKGKCPVCKKTFKFEEMEADHITPWHEGGETTVKNCQMLCKYDNRRKSGK